MGNEIVLDIETNLAHDTIWCVGVREIDSGRTAIHYAPVTLHPVLENASKIVGHNIIGFDSPVLRKVWGIKIPDEKLLDTLVMSRLYHPSIEGGHSLKAWGGRIGKYKDDFNVADFDKGLTDEMVSYCQQDVLVTANLLAALRRDMKASKFSEYSVELEHQVAVITQKQVENGFRMDTVHATCLYNELMLRQDRITEELQETFPPITHKRVSEKTGKQLADRIEVFNAGSRKQIAERLIASGVKLTKKTENGAIIVDEKVLEGINRPEARLMHEYLLLQKRTSMLESWLKFVDRSSGRVHGKVMTNGAVTGRMTHHSPNMAQCPSTKSLYGTEFRQCWTVDSGNVLVGIDASGLELRMLAHYMNDDAYTQEILSGDIHTMNMKAAGITSRDQAKTFIYAFLYGAGAVTLGETVGGSAKEGKKLINDFMKAVPAIGKLKEKIARIAASGSVPALDGRRIRIRSPHAALNSLLQSAGAIIMKQALVILIESLEKHDIPYKLVANVHDEWQIETPEKYGNIVGKAGCRAIEKAGKHFDMRCPLAGDYNVGKSWAETH